MIPSMTPFGSQCRSIYWWSKLPCTVSVHCTVCFADYIAVANRCLVCEAQVFLHRNAFMAEQALGFLNQTSRSFCRLDPEPILALVRFRESHTVVLVAFSCSSDHYLSLGALEGGQEFWKNSFKLGIDRWSLDFFLADPHYLVAQLPAPRPTARKI